MSCDFCALDSVAALGHPLLVICEIEKKQQTHKFHEHCAFTRLSEGKLCPKEGCKGKVTHVNGKTVDQFKKEVDANEKGRVPDDRKADFDEFGSSRDTSDAENSDVD